MMRDRGVRFDPPEGAEWTEKISFPKIISEITICDKNYRNDLILFYNGGVIFAMYGVISAKKRIRCDDTIR